MNEFSSLREMSSGLAKGDFHVELTQALRSHSAGQYGLELFITINAESPAAAARQMNNVLKAKEPDPRPAFCSQRYFLH